MALETVGVEAVVEGLSAFVGGVDKINSSMEKLGDTGNFLERAFDTVTNAVGSFGREILNVVEVAVGVLLRDAFNWMIDTLKELAIQVYNVSSEFQQLKLRLYGFNLQAAIDETRAYSDSLEELGERAMSGRRGQWTGLQSMVATQQEELYTDAVKQATLATEEQLNWIMKLAAVTPFDATDIADTFTLARSYGFTADESKRMTENILDFTAAMGLTNVEATRIIVNFGQMVQRGKITTREMNDLARGSFVPLADVLDRVSEKMGITTAELTKMISKPGGGVDYQLFLDAFNEMVETEERFENGAARMARTFRGATENIIQSLRDILGYYIVMPAIMDPLGERLAGFMDEVALRWDDITDAAERLGNTIGTIFGELLDIFMPDAETAVDGLILAINKLNVWLLQNKDGIIKFFTDIATTIREDVIPWVTDKFLPAVVSVYEWFVKNWPRIEAFFMGIYTVIREQIVPWIEDHLVPAFQTFSDWVDNHKRLINEFFYTLGEIIGDTFSKLFGMEDAKEGQGGLEGFLETLKDVMQWIIDHKEDISDWAATFLEIYGKILLAKWALGVLWDFLVGTYFSFTASSIAWNWAWLTDNIFSAQALGELDVLLTSGGGGENIGKKIIDSIVNGVVNAAQSLVNAVLNAIIAALNAASSWLTGYKIPYVDYGGGGGGLPPPSGTTSPQMNSSKETAPLTSVLKNIGTQTASKETVSVVRAASGAVASKETGPTTVMHLTVNTQATKESVVQDYRMLQSMVAI